MFHLLFPLDDVRDGVRLGEFDVAVEDDRVAHHGRQMLGVLHLRIARTCHRQDDDGLIHSYITALVYFN